MNTPITLPPLAAPTTTGPGGLGAGAGVGDAAAWSQSRHVSMTRARKQARNLRWARTVFIALSALSGGSVIVFAVVHSLTERFAAPAKVSTEEAIELVRPKFLGRDAEGREFSVSAESAVRSFGDNGPIALRQPVFENANKQRLASPNGDYDSAGHRLVLRGGVELNDAHGNRFRSPTAEINTKANIASGDQGVTGEGPLGSVSAEAYEIFSLEGRIILRGKVRGVIEKERKLP